MLARKVEKIQSRWNQNAFAPYRRPPCASCQEEVFQTLQHISIQGTIFLYTLQDKWTGCVNGNMIFLKDLWQLKLLAHKIETQYVCLKSDGFQRKYPWFYEKLFNFAPNDILGVILCTSEYSFLWQGIWRTSPGWSCPWRSFSQGFLLMTSSLNSST